MASDYVRWLPAKENAIQCLRTGVVQQSLKFYTQGDLQLELIRLNGDFLKRYSRILTCLTFISIASIDSICRNFCPIFGANSHELGLLFGRISHKSLDD